MATFWKNNSYFFSLILILSLLHTSHGAPRLSKHPRCWIRSIYSLGDSIADTGNLLQEGTGAAFSAIGHLPYGQTTFGKPTGRCSDGLLMIDYLASALHLPLVTPYLEKDGNFKRGVNFAVAGATALDTSFFTERGIMMPYTNSSLHVQLEWFRSHLNSAWPSPTERAKRLNHALILVGEIGGNDYNYAFLSGKSTEDLMSYVPHVVQTIVNAARELIDMGATQLVVPGNFPIGCMPVYLAAVNTQDESQYDHHKCLINLNAFAIFHNVLLQEALEFLRKAYPHVLIMYADYYQAFMHLIDNAATLGFNESSLLKACCGGGGVYNFDMNKMCGFPGADVCTSPAKSISWDGIHPTQAAYRIMARTLMTGEFLYPDYGVQEKWNCLV